ncbi:hypothetical protein [Thiolapillus sp.]|uniref:hypothetical protein n=6 Tax=Thiolapillus sp. TaxID=2017437 RepID=UPI0025D13F42|nr:hypothetical protein [Thiolapillus sp.]
MPQTSWSPSTTQQLRKLVAAPYLPPNDWTPRLDAYFASPLALCARRVSSAASRLLGTTSLRFALHGWQRMFNQLKLSWGLKEAWQQTRQTLHRWVHLTLAGYGLIQLLGYLDDQTVRQLCCHSPWRKDNPTTAGQIRKGLLLIFRKRPRIHTCFPHLTLCRLSPGISRHRRNRWTCLMPPKVRRSGSYTLRPGNNLA